MRSSRRALVFLFHAATTELPALARSEKLAPDERKNHEEETK